MRITNIMSGPHYFQYAASAGRTLQSGEQSAEIPLDAMFRPELRADVKSDRIRIRLSDQDKQELAWLQEQDTRKIEIKKPVPKPVPPPVKKPLIVAPVLPPNSKVPVSEKPAEPRKHGHSPSLQDLKDQNKGVKFVATPGVPQTDPPPGPQEALKNAKSILGGKV